eukprot:m.415614 g.415614  ORF g.415614 m.415614 type:complete len:841 (+) comp29701_c0_seq1:331-2853(+)
MMGNPSPRCRDMGGEAAASQAGPRVLRSTIRRHTTPCMLAMAALVCVLPPSWAAPSPTPSPSTGSCLGVDDPATTCSAAAVDCSTDAHREACPGTCGTCFHCHGVLDGSFCRRSSIQCIPGNGVDEVCPAKCDVCPSASPTVGPTATPTAGPTRPPTAVPTGAPTRSPTAAPSSAPTMGFCLGVQDSVADCTDADCAAPEKQQTCPATCRTCFECGGQADPPFCRSLADCGSASVACPARCLTCGPTAAPSAIPTLAPTGAPTPAPTTAPTAPTAVPTVSPTFAPSAAPTLLPTAAPTAVPSVVPTAVPTEAPSAAPSSTPTGAPTATPTRVPTPTPTAPPTAVPSLAPSAVPTTSPTAAPSASPTAVPSATPTASPSATPTASPSRGPSATPSSLPTRSPSAEPTAEPSEAPTVVPTGAPSGRPTEAPTAPPTSAPTASPTRLQCHGVVDSLLCDASVSPPCTTDQVRLCPAHCGACGPAPTQSPTAHPTAAPTELPTGAPTAAPTGSPTGVPTTVAPTAGPTPSPTAVPSVSPTGAPTAVPTANPTQSPSAPTAAPTGAPTPGPTATPTVAPPPATLRGALALLNDAVPVTSWIRAINGSPAVLAALASAGAKTMLAPSDLAVGSTALTDSILLAHLFEGNLTAEALSSLSKIVSVSGETYTVSTTNVSTRSRRTVLIRIANSQLSALLTFVNIPSSAGTVHGTDTLLVPRTSADDTSDNSAAVQFFEGSDARWFILGVAVLFLVLLLVVVAVSCKQRSRHGAKKGNLKVEEVSTWNQADEFDVVNSAIQSLQQDAGGKASRRHYYPTAHADRTPPPDPPRLHTTHRSHAGTFSTIPE